MSLIAWGVAKHMIDQIDGQTEEEEWTPPEFINCIKVYMDDFKNDETAETKIRNIWDEYDIEIKRLKFYSILKISSEKDLALK